LEEEPSVNVDNFRAIEVKLGGWVLLLLVVIIAIISCSAQVALWSDQYLTNRDHEPTIVGISGITSCSIDLTLKNF
jgi:hypothetical protein